MSIHKKEEKKVTTHVLHEMKARGEKISMLTAYDFSMARVVDQAGIDVILVGDSASNVMAGHETTLPITLDQMIYHASSVVRGVSRALVVVDLPFEPVTAITLGAMSKPVQDCVAKERKNRPMSLSRGIPSCIARAMAGCGLG
jgi:3-methyl-2-oxobutanoate hydroxymethyltransferase